MFMYDAGGPAEVIWFEKKKAGGIADGKIFI